VFSELTCRRTTLDALLVVVLLGLSVSIVLPAAHAKMQLKAGDTWTLSGKSTYTASGWGAEAGKYYETDSFTNTFKVDSFDGTKLAISQVNIDSWSYTATGWFLSVSGASTSGTNTHNYRYIVNSTTLRIIAETWTKDDKGYPTWVLIDPSTLAQGAAVTRTWWTPTSGNSTTIATNVQMTVSGSQTIPFNGTNLQIWNVTYTGITTGNWYYSPGVNTYAWSVGPETDVSQYDSNYGILVGFSWSGAYTATEHCMGNPSCNGGGWTDTGAGSYRLTNSNLEGGSYSTASNTATLTSSLTYAQSVSETATSTAAQQSQAFVQTTQTPSFATVQQMTQQTFASTSSPALPIIGGVIVAVLALLAALYFVKSRRKPEGEGTHVWDDRQVTVTIGKEAYDKRFCVECGEALPLNSKFCNKCGTQQP